VVQAINSVGLAYAGERSVVVAYDILDFYGLQQLGLIIMTSVGANQWSGKPTELGLRTIFGTSRRETPDDSWFANPFPVGTRAHEMAKDMQLWAKEHLALFYSEVLQKMPPEEASTREFLEHQLEFVAGTFDIWVRAFSMLAAPTVEAAVGFEHLLIELEKAVVAQAMKSRPSFIRESLFSSEVTIRLNQRRQFWTGQILRKVREHQGPNSTKVASRGNDKEPGVVGVNEQEFNAAGNGDATPKLQDTADGLETTLSWNSRLRAARENAKLSRPGAATRLKTQGVQITADAIKKHEEGAAMPRPEVRQAYSVIYKTTEDALFG
jgi:hypothetical protein